MSAGTLELALGGDTAGSFAVSPGAELIFGGAEDFVLNSGTTFTGLGAVVIRQPDVEIAANITVPNLHLRGGAISGPAVLHISHMLVWAAGSMIGTGSTEIQTNAILHATDQGQGDRFLTRVINNYGWQLRSGDPAIGGYDSGNVPDIPNI